MEQLTCKFSPYNCRLWYSGNLTRERNILPFDYFLILWFRNPFRRNWIKARTCSKVDDEERGFGEHQKFNHCVVSRIFQHRCGFRLRACKSRCCVCVFVHSLERRQQQIKYKRELRLGFLLSDRKIQMHSH